MWTLLDVDHLDPHQISPNHYENTPIQIYRKFHLQKTENFQIKNSNIFHISAQNIDCGYSLELPRRGGSKEYHNQCFLAEIWKIMYTPVNPSFFYIKVGFKGIKFIKACFRDGERNLMRVNLIRIKLIRIKYIVWMRPLTLMWRCINVMCPLGWRYINVDATFHELHIPLGNVFASIWIIRSALPVSCLKGIGKSNHCYGSQPLRELTTYSGTSMARIALGPWKFVRDMGCSSHWGLIIAPGQKADGNNLGKSFRFSTQ